jgi:hypothetical protein
VLNYSKKIENKMITYHKYTLNMVNIQHTALAADHMLTIVEFIEVTKYPIDTFMIDRFWNTMEHNRLIYVDDELISWMGYSANTIAHRKAIFCKMLPQNGIGYREYSGAEYKKWYKTNGCNIYPNPKEFTGKGRTKHLLLEPDCLRNIMMRVNTTKGDQVRKYYTDLEKLFKAYIIYQTQYQMRSTNAALLAKEAELAEKTQLLQQKDSVLSEQTSIITTKEMALQEKSALVAKMDEQINRIGNQAQELIKYKQFTTKDESVYVISTADLARQGLFKVGRTKNMVQRVAQYNTGHPVGDEMVVLKEVKTCNGLNLENRLRHILKHFRPIDRQEYYKIRYNLLSDMIDLCEEHQHYEEVLANDYVHDTHTLAIAAAPIDWLGDAALILTPPLSIQAAPTLLAIEAPPAKRTKNQAPKRQTHPQI